jgi:hypothetical protein
LRPIGGTILAVRRIIAAAALPLGLAACSSGGTASPPAHQHTSKAASPAPSPAQPSTGPAAQSAVTSTWLTFFNGAVPIPRRIVLLQNGQAFASFVHSQDKTSLGALVLEASAKVSSVTLEPPDQASVTYTILLGGKPLAKNLNGTAVYSGGAWKISMTTFCGLLHVAYSSKPSLIPAVCG